MTSWKLFLKMKEEEDEATGLTEEMRKSVEALQNTKVSRRSKVCAALFDNTSIVTTKIRVVPGP